MRVTVPNKENGGYSKRSANIDYDYLTSVMDWDIDDGGLE